MTNFGHFSFDVQISDLYCFMRKILEKYNWDVFLARRMLEQYDKIRPISSEEWETCKSVSHIRKNTGNWQITTFLTTKHGFRQEYRKAGKGNCPEENMGGFP